jgi:hypothetical protein
MYDSSQIIAPYDKSSQCVGAKGQRRRKIRKLERSPGLSLFSASDGDTMFANLSLDTDGNRLRFYKVMVE